MSVIMYIITYCDVEELCISQRNQFVCFVWYSRCLPVQLEILVVGEEKAVCFLWRTSTFNEKFCTL